MSCFIFIVEYMLSIAGFQELSLIQQRTLLTTITHDLIVLDDGFVRIEERLQDDTCDVSADQCLQVYQEYVQMFKQIEAYFAKIDHQQYQEQQQILQQLRHQHQLDSLKDQLNADEVLERSLSHLW